MLKQTFLCVHICVCIKHLLLCPSSARRCIWCCWCGHVCCSCERTGICVFCVWKKKALSRLKAQRGKKEGTIDARFREVVWQLMDAEVKKENSLVLQGITQASVCSLLEKNHSPSLLVDVSLCGCQLTTVPECLSTLSRLEILDLRNNAIASFEPIYNALLPHHCWNRLKLFVFLFSCSCLIYMS